MRELVCNVLQFSNLWFSDLGFSVAAGSPQNPILYMPPQGMRGGGYMMQPPPFMVQYGGTPPRPGGMQQMYPQMQQMRGPMPMPQGGPPMRTPLEQGSERAHSQERQHGPDRPHGRGKGGDKT